MYGLCGTWGLTVEETGRRARYDFLRRTAAAVGAERIATAHHRDDLAETVLLQLLRGTGPQGLTGIPPVRDGIIRPLLDTPRRDIEQYIEENGLAYVPDETNGDLHYARNRLRLEVWPMLEGINPEAAAHIARTADILRRENAYLDELAAARLPEAGRAVDCGALLAAPEALRPRMLRLLLERLGTYFAFRYLLKAVNDGDLLGQAQFCVLMVLTAQRLTAVCGFWEAVRRLCCEVEHSEENLEALRLAFLRDAALSPGAFLCQLRS